MTLVIVGRRWFRKSAGNTYCRAEVYRDGEHVLTTPITLGYGDFYVQYAVEKMINRGLLPPKNEREADWQYFERIRVKCSKTVADVRRESDL